MGPYVEHKSTLERQWQSLESAWGSGSPLTTMKYRTQSAEHSISKTNVILPSSEPVAPVRDVGGLCE